MNQHPPNYFSSNGNLLPINCTFPGVSSSLHHLHPLKQVNSINNRCHHYHCNAMPPPTTTSLHFHHRIVLNSIRANHPLCLSSPSQTTNKPLIQAILPKHSQVRTRRLQLHPQFANYPTVHPTMLANWQRIANCHYR